MKLATSRWRIPLGLTGVLLLAGLMAPAALGAAKSQLSFLTQPGDTKVNATIRAVDFDEATKDATLEFVKVRLVDGMGRPLANKTVSFKLVTDDGAAAPGLQVIPQLTDASGEATFREGTLSISVPNEPEFSPYRLIPITVKGTPVTGDASGPFNIWQDGDSCSGGDDTCTAKLRGDRDIYTTADGGTLGASELSTAMYPNFPSTACPNQKVVFRASMFTNASQPDSPLTAQGVFLRSHITRADFRAAGIDFGQAHVEWCIALKTPWDNGTPSTEWHVAAGKVLHVASAPACPTPNEPWRFAPCITAQFSDGAGGNITEGWIPPGDPVRRT